MSNHSGARMLNEVLYTLDEDSVFKKMTLEEKRHLAKKIIKIGESEDCESSAIIEGLEEELGLCSCCLKETTQLEEGLCLECRD